MQSAVLAAGLRSHVLLKRTIFGLRPTVSSLASRPRVGGGTTFRWAHCPSPASRISPRLHGATGGIKSRTLGAHSAAHAVDGSRAICPICRERRHGVRWRPLARLPSRAPHSAVTHSRRRRDAIGSDGDCAPPPHLWQKRRRAARWELISLGDIPRTHGTPRPVLRCSAFRASHLHPTKAPQPCKRSRNAPTGLRRRMAVRTSTGLCSDECVSTRLVGLPLIAGLPPECWNAWPVRKVGRTTKRLPKGRTTAAWRVP